MSCNTCRRCLAPLEKTMTQTHTVATDALATIGNLIDETAGRDAIHLAVEPAVAGERLHPADHVGRDQDGRWTRRKRPDALGIVDPFLDAIVQEGQRFWLVVYPRQITSLRHVWEHPAFGPTPAVVAVPLTPEQASRKWIEDFAARIPLNYETVMEGAHNMVMDRRAGGYGEYLNFGGLLEGESVPQAFWPHYETVTGEKVEEDHRQSFFTCSC